MVLLCDYLRLITSFTACQHPLSFVVIVSDFVHQKRDLVEIKWKSVKLRGIKCQFVYYRPPLDSTKIYFLMWRLSTDQLFIYQAPRPVMTTFLFDI